MRSSGRAPFTPEHAACDGENKAGRPRTLVQLFRSRAELMGDQRAYVFLKNGEVEHEVLDYASLDRSARAIAARLQNICSRGQRAILMYNPGVEFIRAFLGCQYSGVIAVPAYPPNMTRPEKDLGRLRSIKRSCRAAVVLTHAEIGDALSGGTLPGFEHMDVLSTDTIEDNESAEWTEYDARPEDLALLQYTSGSTAEPKGVMVSHDNLMHNLEFIHSCEANDSSSVSVSWLPPYHDMGLIEGILQPAYAGVPCYLMSPSAFIQKPLRWLRAISKYRASNSGGPNFGYQLCIDRIKQNIFSGAGDRQRNEPLDLSNWRVAYNGSETVRHKTMLEFCERFSPCGFSPDAFRPVYGLAESTLLVAASPANSRWKVHRVCNHHSDTAGAGMEQLESVSCGMTNPDSEIVIVDPSNRTRSKEGSEGEIWVSGRSVAQGYWENPRANLATFSAYLASGEGPFLRTGDLGVRWNGELHVTGRIKDVLIVRGRKYYPQEIEYLIETSVPSVASGGSVAFSIDDGCSEELIVLAEIRNREVNRLSSTVGGGDRPKDEALSRVARSIAQSIVEQFDVSPAAVDLVSAGSVCKTSSGKPMRYACRERYLAGGFNTIETWARPGFRQNE